MESISPNLYISSSLCQIVEHTFSRLTIIDKEILQVLSENDRPKSIVEMQKSISQEINQPVGNPQTIDVLFNIDRKRDHRKTARAFSAQSPYQRICQKFLPGQQLINF